MKIQTFKLFMLLPLLFGTMEYANAFNPSGHFESVGFIVDAPLGDMQLVGGEKYVVAGCAQLPDMNQQMDAVKTYVTAMHESLTDWIRWGASDRLGNIRLQQMFAVQQLVHGLTGGNSAAMRLVSLTTLAKLKAQISSGPNNGPQRVTNLCALGLGIHLWGDTFAHTHVTWGQDATKNQALTMYPTGRGHGLAEGHLPDDILCSYYSKDGPSGDINCHEGWQNSPHRRFELWMDYWSKLGTALNQTDMASFDIDATVPSSVYTPDKLKAIETSISTLYAKNGYGHLTPDGFDLVLRQGIQGILQPDPAKRLKDAMAPFRAEIGELDKVGFMGDYPSCDAILDMLLGLQEVKKLSEGSVNCAAVWLQYYPSAIESFKSVINTATPKNAEVTSALPIDPDWRAVYGVGKDPSKSAPIDCYAKQVALPKGGTGATCPFTN